MGLTTDRNDPCLDVIKDDGQQACHVILSEEERSKGFIRPVRTKYIHLTCGAVTTMPQAIAETYSAKPTFYSGTFCCNCRDYFPVGKNGEFVWDRPEPPFATMAEYNEWLANGERVGT